MCLVQLISPSDGYVDPSSVTQAFARGARKNGVRIEEGVKVLDMIVKDQRVEELVTDQGRVKCNVVVNAAGFWSRELALKAGVKTCLLYTSPSPRDQRGSRMPSSA